MQIGEVAMATTDRAIPRHHPEPQERPAFSRVEEQPLDVRVQRPCGDRLLTILVLHGCVWLVLREVFDLLDLPCSAPALSKLDAREMAFARVGPRSLRKSVALVSESGCLALVYGHPEAAEPGSRPYQFKHWLCRNWEPCGRRPTASGIQPRMLGSFTCGTTTALWRIWCTRRQPVR